MFLINLTLSPCFPFLSLVHASATLHIFRHCHKYTECESERVEQNQKFKHPQSQTEKTNNNMKLLIDFLQQHSATQTHNHLDLASFVADSLPLSLWLPSNLFRSFRLLSIKVRATVFTAGASHFTILIALQINSGAHNAKRNEFTFFQLLFSVFFRVVCCFWAQSFVLINALVSIFFTEFTSSICCDCVPKVTGFIYGALLP